MDNDHAVLFDGTIGAGADLEAVKRRLESLFKATSQQIERLFSGKPVVLRKGLTAPAAQKFVAALGKAGAVAKVVRLGAATAAEAPLTAEQLALQFVGALPRRRLAFTYRIGLAATALLMLLLPVIYLGLITAVAAGLLWYIADVPFPHRVHPTAGLLYLVPPAAASAVIFFMLKPFFAPRPVRRLPVEVSAAKEPLFVAFVNAIADKVGAPRPHTIEVDCEVNAAAAYYRGFHGLANNKLTLIVGLPLVAGMNTRQLAGVLAHEFGHFAQRGGMFATYLVRRINHWFYRAVHERDQWDERLAAVVAGEGWFSFVAGAARLCVGLVRRILAGFLWVAEIAGHYMLRQMEFDADSYEARVAGSGQFRENSLQLRRLDYAFREVYVELGELWNRRQLVDDLPAMVARKAGGLAPEVLRQLEAAMQEGRQDVFATHPPDDARVARAQALKAPGIFALERPAGQLLKNYATLARAASLRFYRNLGFQVKEEQLVSKETMASAVTQARQQDQSLNDYCKGLFIGYRFLAPWEPSRFGQLADEARRQRLNELVAGIRQSLPEIDRQRAEFERLSDLLAPAFARYTLCQQPSERVQAMARDISPKNFTALQQELGQVKARLSVFEEMLAERMGVALAGALQGNMLSEEERGRVRQAVKALQIIATLQTPRDDLYLQGGALFYGMHLNDALLQSTSGAEGLPAPLFETWRQGTGRAMDNIAAALDAVAYPFERAGGAASVWAHMREHLPRKGTSLFEHFEHITPFFQGVQSQYTQMMRYLADVAARYESSLGVMPISIRVGAGR